MSSKDGYQWTRTAGLKTGVPTIGAIQPPSNLKGSEGEFDVLVVGGGYCGLTAARDAANYGLRVLLIEARDRIGGRSWSSNIGGYPYEMGGTWVHWAQPHVWREISRYQMRDEIVSSYDFSKGLNKFLLVNSNGTQAMSHDEEDSLMESALTKVVNVDGQNGRLIMPFPHTAKYSADALAYDEISVADRIDQIKDTLTPNERAGVEGFVLLCSGGTTATTSFFEFLHWWALCEHTYRGCIEYLVKYKFVGGQSSFAIKFFNESLATNKLSYVMETPIAKVEQGKDSVKVIARNGRTFKGARLISTVPLNVLDTITFEPSLSPEKIAAFNIKHVNQCIKVHAEVTNTDLRSWTGINYPNNKLLYGFGDGTLPNGNTHVVTFGAQHNHFEPDETMEETLEALNGLVVMKVEKVVGHNWSKDEFAKGAWFFPAPRYLGKYLDILRAREGNVFFHSSDWALGWRSFIDGAIEEGTRAALAVKLDLASRANEVRSAL
ncbi:monoamine oxidase N [Paraphoma chrysanthemicola]|nr:monoamine oxidase N [Paraphoma chrysanthemicola]